MKLGHLTATALCLTLVGAGCGKSDASPEGGKELAYPYRITTTVGMVTDIVQQVAGEHARVTGIIGSGIDPHLYKPTRGDLLKLDEADIVFYSGLHLEGKMIETFERVGEEKPVHAVTKLIDPKYLLASANYPDQHDPHVWMDVSAWAKCVASVADELAKFDPPHAEEYQAHAEALIAECEKLHAYGLERIGSISEGRRVLITSHDAFNYFGRAYGLEVRGVQGISTESEAGLHDINTLVDYIVARGITAVFVETSVAQKNIRALIEGASSKGQKVHIGGELFSDAMGEAGTYEGTYLGMLDHNITIVTRALGGDAPARGLNGKLTLPADAGEALGERDSPHFAKYSTFPIDDKVQRRSNAEAKRGQSLSFSHLLLHETGSE